MTTLNPVLLGVPTSGGSPDKVRRVVNGKLVVVTGATRGIGREVTMRLIAVGATVVGIARSEQTLRELARRGTRSFIPLAGDLRDLDWANEAGRRILDDHGTPTLLVSNAGHSIHRYLDQYSDRFHDVTRTAGVNYLGAVALALPLLDAMRTAKAGHIISVASAGVDIPVPGWSVYNASKQAMESWLSAVGPELRSQRVATTSIHLPRVTTSMSAATAGRYPAPELTVGEAADVICRAIVNKPRFIVPWWARLGAGLTGVAPGAVQGLWQLLLASGVRP